MRTLFLSLTALALAAPTAALAGDLGAELKQAGKDVGKAVKKGGKQVGKTAKDVKDAVK